MKKLMLVALACASTVAYAEQDVAKAYFQADVLGSQWYAKDVDGTTTQDESVGFRLTWSQEANAWRYGADYTYLGKLTDEEKTAATYSKAELSGHALGVSAIYDAKNSSKVTPYLGARVALNNLRLKSEDVAYASNTSWQRVSSHDHTTKLSAGVLAGVNYAVSDSASIGLGLGYDYMGKIKQFDDAKLGVASLSLGVKYAY